MMNDSRHERAMERLKAAGFPSRDLLPLFHRMMWHIGIPVPPPLFAPFHINVLVFWLAYGAVATLGMAFGPAQRLVVKNSVLLCGAAFGLALALLMAAFFLRTRLVNKLPTWRELGTQ
jgi:hypothetical protein